MKVTVVSSLQRKPKNDTPKLPHAQLEYILEAHFSAPSGKEHGLHGETPALPAETIALPSANTGANTHTNTPTHKHLSNHNGKIRQFLPNSYRVAKTHRMP